MDQITIFFVINKYEYSTSCGNFSWVMSTWGYVNSQIPPVQLGLNKCNHIGWKWAGKTLLYLYMPSKTAPMNLLKLSA